MWCFVTLMFKIQITVKMSVFQEPGPVTLCRVCVICNFVGMYVSNNTFLVGLVLYLGGSPPPRFAFSHSFSQSCEMKFGRKAWV